MLLFAYAWRYRWHLIIPMVLCPIAAALLLMGQTPNYTATTTLHLDPTKVRSPLLQNLTAPEHTAILRRTLTSKSVVSDTLSEMGVVMDGLSLEQQTLKRQEFMKQVSLETLGNGLVRVEFESSDPNSIEDVLATLSFNFIQEVLAPERFRLGQQLSTLEQQIKTYAEHAKNAQTRLDKLSKHDVEVAEIVAAEFEVQRLEAQRRMAQEEYDNLLSRQKTFFNPFNRDDPSTVMWFVEPPVLKAVPTSLEQRQLWIIAALPLGLLIGLALIMISRMTDRSLCDPQSAQKYLGHPVLGQIPNLGPVSLERGRMTIQMTSSKA
jgi:uncharacterized protein involved in exopolysaccharide biosynthesis